MRRGSIQARSQPLSISSCKCSSGGRQPSTSPGPRARCPGPSGDGSDICLARRNGQHFYIAREAHGDCPAGCIHESFTGVSVDADGNLVPVGTWDGTGRAPGWFEDALDCRPFLATHEP
jgi:hypothetical protein